MFQLQDNQAVDLAVTATDEAGNHVPADAVAIAWAVSDESVLAVETTPTGATITATGKLGTAQVQVTDTASGLGAGTLDVEVTTGPAVAFTITPGAPRDADGDDTPDTP